MSDDLTEEQQKISNLELKFIRGDGEVIKPITISVGALIDLYAEQLGYVKVTPQPVEEIEEDKKINGFKITNGKYEWILYQGIEFVPKLTSLTHGGKLEIVICSAIKYKDDSVIRGHRHGDCVFDCDRPLKKDFKGHVQGFITSYNRFVTREEGRKLQDAAGIESIDGYRGDTLFSEDLY